MGIITIAAMPSMQPEFYPGRYLVTSWAVFAVLIATAYSSNLVSHLTIPLYSMRLDSIQDIVRADISWISAFENDVNLISDLEVSIQQTGSRNYKTTYTL
jgi:hypothetical protein